MMQLDPSPRRQQRQHRLTDQVVNKRNGAGVVRPDHDDAARSAQSTALPT